MRNAVFTLILLLLVGCSGGQSSAPAVAVVSGVAATGAAVSGTVSLKDANGREVSKTTTDGTFTFDIAAVTPPFILKASWNGKTMYSFATASGTANITPITHMIVSAAAGGADLDALYDTPSPATLTTIATNLPAAKTSVKDNLKSLIRKYNADIDPISGAFSTDGTGMDGLLDHVTVNIAGGSVSVTDKTSASTLFTAPISPTLANGVSSMSWDNTDAAAAQEPDLKVSDSGDGIAVWWEWVGSNYGASVIKARWLTSETTATQLSTANGFASTPKVAVDPSGNAVVAWMQYDTQSQTSDIWVNRFVHNLGWKTAKRLTNTAAPTSGPSGNVSLAMDASGNAIVMWNEFNGAIPSHFDLFTSRYSAAADTWSAPAMLTNGTNSAYGMKIVANSGGKAAVIYNQFRRTDGVGGNGDASDMWVATGTVIGGFTSSAKVSVGSNLIYGQATLAIAPSGEVVAGWIQNNDSGYFDMWVNRQGSGGSWGSAQTIANTSTGECYFPEVAMDQNGNAFAVWEQQSDAEGRQFVAASRYTASGGWSQKTEISANTGNTFDHHTAVDPSGNATAVWYQIETGAVRVRSTRYLTGSGWGTSQLISTMGSTYDGYTTSPAPRVAGNASGKTFIIWGTTSY